MKRLDKRQRKLDKASAVLLLIAAIISLAGASFSAYTNQGFKKAVVTTSSSAIRFSSNYLNQYLNSANKDSYEEKVYPFSISGDTGTIEVTVCNNPQKQSSQHNTNDISYTISFKTDGIGYAVNGKALSQNAAYIINDQTLVGTKSDSNRYVITIPASQFDTTNVEVTVTPDDQSTSAASNMVLYRVLKPMSAGTIGDNSFNWTGEFIKKTGTESTEYHAFNYRVSGTNGRGTVTLSWNPKYLAIDETRISSDMVLTKGSDKHQLVISVDAANLESYTLVFFRTGTNMSDESWEKLISFSKEENIGTT